MTQLRQITLKGATGQFRTAVFENKDYVVVPVIALVEGVIQAMNSTTPELVLAEEFSIAPGGWNGRPVMVNHPTEPEDPAKPISANSPETLERLCIGKVFNTRVVKKQLHMEAWIDIAKCSALGGEAQALLDRVLEGVPVEVSVGVFVVAEEKQGAWNGKDYGFIWRELVPDHLALLSEGHIGACSNAMGCGVRAAAVHTITPEGFKPMSEPVAKRSLRERLQGILPFRTNAKGYSDNDVRDALREAIRQQEPLYAYIESVYESDGYFIYCTAMQTADSYEEHYYRRSFSLDKPSGAITLGTDRMEVEPVVEFKPLQAVEGQPKAACSCSDAPKPPSDKETNVDRTQRIDALMKNEKSPVREQKALEALTDDGLTALETAVQAASKPAAPAEPAKPAAEPAPKTAEQFMAEAPPELRSLLTKYQKQEEAHRTGLITQLKSAQKTYTEAELNAMTVEQLEKTASLLNIEAPTTDVNYSGRVPRAAQSTEPDFTPPDPYAPKAKN